MKIVSKILAASILALSVAAPAFAAEETTLLERNTYTQTAPVDARAHAPAPAPKAQNTTVRDLGIASQS
jgi:predicted cobalt transporter CbtA